MGRSTKQVEVLNAALDGTIERLQAVQQGMPNPFDPNQVQRGIPFDPLNLQSGMPAPTGELFRRGGNVGLSSSRTTGGQSSEFVPREPREPNPEVEERRAWQEYVRQSNRMGLYGRQVLNFNDWKRLGGPRGFEFRGGEPPPGSLLNDPRFPTFGQRRPNGPQSPGFTGQNGPGFGPNVYIPGTGRVTVQDDTVASEVKALHNTIRQNGGLL